MAAYLLLVVYLYFGARYALRTATVLRSDPALIEYPAFDHARALRGDGRGLASACACEDQGRGLGLSGILLL